MGILSGPQPYTLAKLTHPDPFYVLHVPTKSPVSAGRLWMGARLWTSLLRL